MCVFRKADLALAEPEFVSAAIKEDVRLGTWLPARASGYDAALLWVLILDRVGMSIPISKHSVAAGGSGPYYWSMLARA